VVSTIAGDGTAGFANGPGNAARFNYPAGITIDGAGNLYVADSGNNRIRKIDSGGNVSTIAGDGIAAYLDGNGTAAKFDYPMGITIDAARNLYVADTYNHRIRKIDSGGNVSTIAGSGRPDNIHEGPGTAVRFYDPCGICIDGTGNLYVVGGSSVMPVRRIANDPSRTVSFLGPNIMDVGPAKGITIDSSGNLYTTNTGKSCIRKLSWQLIN
jgi:sugar lactone lactonase YvrE